MKLKIKKLHPAAVMPSRAYPGDAGWDLTALNYEYKTRYHHIDERLDAYRVHVNFGIAVEIPSGHVGLIFPRSSIYKTELRLSNALGVIDSGYRGELKAVFDIISESDDLHRDDVREVNWCKPCAQLVIVPIPEVELEEVDELSPSERGTGGYGSSDERRKG